MSSHSQAVNPDLHMFHQQSEGVTDEEPNGTLVPSVPFKRADLSFPNALCTHYTMCTAIQPHYACVCADSVQVCGLHRNGSLHNGFQRGNTFSAQLTNYKGIKMHRDIKSRESYTKNPIDLHRWRNFSLIGTRISAKDVPKMKKSKNHKTQKKIELYVAQQPKHS